MTQQPSCLLCRTSCPRGLSHRQHAFSSKCVLWCECFAFNVTAKVVSWLHILLVGPAPMKIIYWGFIPSQGSWMKIMRQQKSWTQDNSNILKTSEQHTRGLSQLRCGNIASTKTSSLLTSISYLLLQDASVLTSCS